MSPADAPLTRERIITAAEDVIRRFGPEKATVTDVARALGVSHAALYRHIATKAELRDLVVGRCSEARMPAMRAIVAASGPAPQRLRQFFDELVESKRAWAAQDPELFAAYRTLAAEAKATSNAHVDDLVALAATIVAQGVDAGEFRKLDADSTARAILNATLRFHHPVHAGDWNDANIDAIYNDVWDLLMTGLLA